MDRMKVPLGTPVVVGFDASLASTGYAVLTYEDGDLVKCGLLETTSKESLARRLVSLRRQVRAVLYEHDSICDVAIEGGISRNGKVTRVLAMAWGVVAVEVMSHCGIDPAEPAPTTIKLFATGSGAAKKPKVVAAAVERWGPAANQDDIADACWVAEWHRHQLHRSYSLDTTTHAL